MKYLKISTTNKLYLMTMVFIFIIIFINQTVFAQSENTGSRSDKRMMILNRYMSWIKGSEYGNYQEDLGKRTLSEFNSYLSRIIPENQTCLKETDDLKLTDCKLKIKNEYKLARKYNRVLKYLQIQEGKPNVCVKADMGIGTALKALPDQQAGQPTPGVEAPQSTQSPQSSKELPVYLCTDSSGTKLVRVLDNSGALLKLSPEDLAKPEFQPQNLPPKDSFDLLIKKLGLTRPAGQISANPNPCTIPQGSQTCGKVRVEWDVSDDTSDPVEVKTKSGKFIKKSRNGSSSILDIGPNGETFILYSLGRKINEVQVKANPQ